MFRGLQLLSEEFSQNYKVGETLNLKGFTSTSMSREKGLDFALNGLNEEAGPIKVPILLEINFKGRNQYFSLNSKEYSAFHGEEEVLLQEGIQYKIEEIEEEIVKVDDDDG